MPKPGNHKKKLSAEAAAAAAPRPEQTRQPTQQRQAQQQQQYQFADQRQRSEKAAAATVELGPALDKLAALLPRAVASYRASGAAQAFKLEDALDAVRVAFNRDLASYNEPQRCSALLSRRELWLQLLQLACYSSRRLVQSPMDFTDMESLVHTINGINSSQGGSEGGGGHSINGLLAGLVADHGLHQAVAAVLTAGVRPAGVATWLAAGAAPPPHSVMGPLPTHIACLSARALLQGHTLRVYGRLAATLADSVALQLPPPPPEAATVAAAASTTGTGASAVATNMAPVAAAAAGAGGGGRPMAGVMLDVGWDAPVDICSALQEQQMLTLRICAGSLITDITCLPGEAARPDTSAAATAATDATSNSRGSSSSPPGPPPGPAAVAAAVPLQELLFQELAASGFLENTARLAVNCAALNAAGSSSSGSSSGSSSSGGGAAGGSGALPPPYRPAGHLVPTLTAAVDGLRLAVARVVAPWMQHAVELGATLGSRGGGPASGGGTSSQGSGGSSRQALSPRPPLPWGGCLRFLALSQVVVTLAAAGYGGGVRGVWGLPQQLVAGLPVLGLAEEDGGGGNTACDLRGKLRRYAEVQQLVRAARQQQQQQPPTGRNQAVGYVLHRGPFELLSQILLVDVVAAKLDDMTATTTSTAKSRCSGSGGSSSSSRSWTFPFSCRALQEVLLGVAEMAAGAPAADTSMRQGEALRPRLCLPQSAAWGIGTAALALARRLQLRAPCSDGDGGGSGGDCWPRMRSRWWRAVVGLLRAEAPYHRRVPSDVAGSFFLTISKVLLLERMPGLLLPPRAPPGLEAALAAGLLPAVEFALSRTAPDEDAAEIIGAVFQIGPTFASVQSGCSWPQLQQLLAFAAPAQTAALIGSLGKRAHAALHAAEAAKAGQAADAAGCATGAIGAAAAAQQAARQPARLGGAQQVVLVETRAQQAELCRTVPVACWALVALLPPSPWACLTSSGGRSGGVGGCGGAGAGGVDGAGSCEDGSASQMQLQMQLQFLSPQQHLACVASRAHATAAANALRHVDFGWLQAAVALQGGGGGSTGGGTSSSSSSSPAAGHEEQCQEQAQEQLLTRTQQVRLLVSQALHSWLPVLSRCVRSPAYLGVQERLAEAPLLQLLLWVQPALLATLNYEADAQLLAAAGPAAAAAGTVVGEAAAEIVAIAAETQRRQLLVPELEMLKAHIYNSFAKTAADIAASWRQFLLRDVDLVAVLEVGLQALSRLPPAAGTHQAGRDLAQCLATALAAAVHAVPDALIPVLQAPGKARPAAAPGSSSRGGRIGSSSGGAGPSSPWGAEEMHGLFRRHVWSSPSATGSSCTVGVGDAARPAGSSGFYGSSGGGRSSLSPSAQLVTCLSFVEELRQAAAAGGTRGRSSGGGSRAAAGPRAGGAPAAAAAAEATGGTASGILGGLEHRRRRLNLLLLPDRLGGVGAGSAGGGGTGWYAAGRQMLVLPLSPMEAAHREGQHAAGGAGRQ